jgi:TonB family protein
MRLHVTPHSLGVTLLVALAAPQAAMPFARDFPEVCVEAFYLPPSKDEVGRLLNDWRRADPDDQSSRVDAKPMIIVTSDRGPNNARRTRVFRGDLEVRVKTEPDYPKEAQEKGISGFVRLIVAVGRDGTVQRVSAACGDPLLVSAAMAAAQKWVFKPVVIDDKPIDFTTELSFKFPS